MAAGMRVDDLAHVPLSFPTYAEILALVASNAARQLNLNVNWQAHQAESPYSLCHPLGSPRSCNRGHRCLLPVVDRKTAAPYDKRSRSGVPRYLGLGVLSDIKTVLLDDLDQRIRNKKLNCKPCVVSWKHGNSNSPSSPQPPRSGLRLWL